MTYWVRVQQHCVILAETGAQAQYLWRNGERGIEQWQAGNDIVGGLTSVLRLPDRDPEPNNG